MFSYRVSKEPWVTEFSSSDAWRATAAEAIAAFLFVFIGLGAIGALIVTGDGEVPGEFILIVGLAHGLGITLGVAAVSHISGAHMNPAVTAAIWLTGQINGVRGRMYVVAQLTGAVALLTILGIDDIGVHAVNSTVLDRSFQALILEAVLTFALVFTVFAVATDRRGPGVIAPLAIGLVIAADHIVAIPLTGTSMNPARSFGPALVGGEWADHWIYWLGPIIGGSLGAATYHWVIRPGGPSKD